MPPPSSTKLAVVVADSKGFYDLLSNNADLGPGHIVGVQGATGTGRSTFIHGMPDPILYINTDLNTKHAKKFHPNKKVAYVNLPLLVREESVVNDRRTLYATLMTVWNAFLSNKPFIGPDPQTGEVVEAPFASITWDLFTGLWDFIYPLKVDEALGKKSAAAQAKGVGPLDFKTSNEWMWGLKDAQKKFRPETTMAFILGEEVEYVPDPSNPSFRIPDPQGRVKPNGWKNTMTCCDAYIRLFRKTKAPDREGQEKRNVRYGELLKFTPNERLVTSTPPIAEPTWADLEEMFRDA